MLSPYDLPRIRTETFVREIDFHWEIESTNTRALHLAEASSVETPLLVLAQQQSQGRGRGENRWWSAAGSLTFSVVLPLDSIPAQHIPQVSLTAGLAICQAVEQVAPLADLGIKWPNDVYLEERKLAGILIERPACQPPLAVVGIGINVNNSASDLPPELAEQSIALRDALGTELDLTELLVHCLNQLEARMQSLRTQPSSIADQWRAYHLLQGRRLELDTYREIRRGVCLGIDDDGALLLQTASGVERCLGGVIRSFERREAGPR